MSQNNPANEEVKKQKAEDDFVQLFLMSLDIICIIDTSTATFLKVNPAFMETLGHSEKELLEKPFFEFIHPDDIDSTRSVIEKKLMQGAKIINFENRYRCRDGSYRWLSWSSRPNLEKGVTYAIARDVTQWKLTEEKLNRSKSLLNTAGHMAKVGGWELDAQTMEVSWTEETYRIHEVPLDYKPPLEEAINFFHPDDRHRLSDAVSNALSEGKPYDLEIRFITARGNHLWARTMCRPEIKDGRVIRLIGTFQDITERKQAQQALLKSEERFRATLENLPGGVFAHDLEGNFILVNSAACRMTGYSKQELLSMNVTSIDPSSITRNDRIRLWNRLHRVNTMTIESTHFRKDGSDYQAEIHLTAITLEGHQIILPIVFDITKRKQAERALKKSEARINAIFQAAQNVSFIITDARDPEPSVLEFSPGAANIFGYSREEMIGNPVSVLHIPEDIARFPQAHEAMRQGKVGFSGEAMLVRKSGEKFPALFSTYPLFDEKGQMFAAVGVSFDISEQHKLETQLRQAQKMESVGRLAGGVAHDFNNMLSIILGNTEIVLEDMNPSDPLIANIKEIYKAAERSRNLTKQLLAFARKQTIDPKVLNLNIVLKDMLNMLQRLIGEDIHLQWLPSPELWPVSIDPTQVDQILTNLCINARDAIEGVGKVTIETANVFFDQAYVENHAGFRVGEYVMTAVSDNGCGIEQEALDSLFEPFFTTKETGRGSGLGLATIYGIVKQNNGFINVYSEPGQGTTFKVYLPRHRQQPHVTAGKNRQKAGVTGNETVLLVEDENSILQMTRMMLERMGYKVMPAGSPNEAIRISSQQSAGEIHLLITDVVMPEMNGRELAGKLQHMYPNLKCLFMSGYTANVIAHHGVLDEGVAFINKPFSKQALALKIREVLDTPAE